MAKTYYPLTHDELLQLSSELKDAELRVYLYLMTLNPFPDSVMEIDTARISEQLGLTRRTIQRAIKRLQELQLIEIEITKFKYKKVVHGSSSRLGSGDIWIASEDFGDLCVATSDPYVATSDPYVATSDTRIVSNDIRIANIPIKPLPAKDSGVSHTIKYSDFIKTLSEEERANFLEFCQKKTKNLSQEVNDIEAWLAHTNKAGQNRWEVYYEKFVALERPTPKKSQSNTSAEKFRAEIDIQRELAIAELRNELEAKRKQTGSTLEGTGGEP